MNYAGDIKPESAYEILKNEKNSYLVDVRTLPEWLFSGIPNLLPAGKEVITLSWMFYPRMEVNTNFADEFARLIEDKDSKIFFMCKVGGRSLDAAIEMTKKGYKNCYNILDGFEGRLNAENQRGKMSGWKAAGLPWQHPG